jgi:hypothetical protein
MQKIKSGLSWLSYLAELAVFWFSAYRKLRRIEGTANAVLAGEPVWLNDYEIEHADEIAYALSREGGSTGSLAFAELAMENAASWLVDVVIDSPVHPNDRDV